MQESTQLGEQPLCSVLTFLDAAVSAFESSVFTPEISPEIQEMSWQQETILLKLHDMACAWGDMSVCCHNDSAAKQLDGLYCDHAVLYWFIVAVNILFTLMAF